MTDWLLLNANVLTMDPARPAAEAIVLDGGRIAFVGGIAEARAVARPGARETDLAGQTLIPSFNEAHNHMLGFDLTLRQIDAGYPAVRSIADLAVLAQDPRAVPPADLAAVPVTLTIGGGETVYEA